MPRLTASLLATRSRGLRFGQAGDERNGEGQCLAGTGLAAAEDVASCQGVGQGVLLDREVRRSCPTVEGLDQLGGNAELGERRGAAVVFFVVVLPEPDGAAGGAGKQCVSVKL